MDPHLLNQDIRIQENIFEELSKQHPRSKGREYEHEHLEGQSNDSLLNESDLNNYFQDQKFSIEDFKSLDKRQILVDHRDDDSDELDDKLGGKNFHQYKFDDLEGGQDSGKLPSQFQLDIPGNSDIFHVERSKNSLDRLGGQPTAFMQHQQAMLFSGAKPGENIKISDILKKT